MRGRQKPVNPRWLAASAITLVEKGALAQEALASALGAFRLDQRDRQLCADLFYGYWRARIRLDFILSHFLKKPERLPQDMLVILGLALHSILFQTKIPIYAAVDEAVREITRRFGRHMGAVANGALRNIARQQRELADPEWYQAARGEDFEGLAIFYGMPVLVANLWRHAYGEQDAISLMRRSFARPRTGMRVNRGHPAAEIIRREIQALDAEAVAPIGEWGFAFAPGRQPEELAGADLAHWRNTGAISFQGAGSMLVLRELGLEKWQYPIWDCCAGMGGKSAALAESGCNARLATDTSSRRLKLLNEDFARLGLPPPNVSVWDASVAGAVNWDGHILADAPCSGLGVLARRPDIRRKALDGEFLREATQRQEKILQGALSALRPGRELAYITCALNPAENGEMAARILAANPRLEIRCQWQTPHDHPWLEGMYGVVFQA